MANEAELVSEIVRAGRAAFGELDVGLEPIAVAVRAALAAGLAADALHASELYLGVACAAGSRAALSALDRMYIARVGDMIARRRLPAHAVDDVRQTVRERLLAGQPPYIASAAGRGSLDGLVAVIATRAALDWLRSHARAAARHGDDDRTAELAATGDPERDHLRARYRDDLKAAFEAAVADLEPRERTMLRFHLVDGMTIDALARLYQIHRATAARQLDKARDRVASGVRRQLERATGIHGDELRELAELVSSQLDLSLSRVLASAA